MKVKGGGVGSFCSNYDYYKVMFFFSFCRSVSLSIYFFLRRGMQFKKRYWNHFVRVSVLASCRRIRLVLEVHVVIAFIRQYYITPAMFVLTYLHILLLIKSKFCQKKI